VIECLIQIKQLTSTSGDKSAPQISAELARAVLLAGWPPESPPSASTTGCGIAAAGPPTAGSCADWQKPRRSSQLSRVAAAAPVPDLVAEPQRWWTMVAGIRSSSCPRPAIRRTPRIRLLGHWQDEHGRCSLPGTAAAERRRPIFWRCCAVMMNHRTPPCIWCPSRDVQPPVPLPDKDQCDVPVSRFISHPFDMTAQHSVFMTKHQPWTPHGAPAKPP
jgi:hypothetical protein